MIVLNDIKSTIQQWIVNTSGLPDGKVIYVKQNSPVGDQAVPRPVKPYITIEVLSFLKVGHDEKLPPDDNGEVEYRGTREFTVSIKGIANDDSMFDTMNLLVDSVEESDTTEYFNQNGLAYFDQLFFDQTDELLETIWERQVQLDLAFRAASVRINTSGSIVETVIIDQKVFDADGSVVLDEPLQVN